MPPGARPGVLLAGTRGAPTGGRAIGTRWRKERESNPQAREGHPFSRRGTAPVAVLPRNVGDPVSGERRRDEASGRWRGTHDSSRLRRVAERARPEGIVREHRPGEPGALSGASGPGGRLRRPGGAALGGARGSGRGRTCNPPVKSRELCLLSYGAGRCGRQESNLRRPAFQTGALPAELRPRVVGGSPSIHLLEAGRSMQRRETPPSICRAVETSALFSKPLTHPSTLDRRPPAALARVVAVLRGGALEPDPRAVPKNCSAN